MQNLYNLTGKIKTGENGKEWKMPAKRVDIVSVKLVKESSLMYKRRKVGKPEDGYEIFKDFLEDLDREVFIVLTLDSKNQPLAINTAHIGNINTSVVSMACVMRVAILSNAASIMVAHNHPSGCPEPSDQDISVTKGLEKASELMGIRLLDHLIIGDDRFVSLKEEGYL